MLLIMYQIFSSLLGHLFCSVHFLLRFYGVTFFGTPNIKKKLKKKRFTMMLLYMYQIFSSLRIHPHFCVHFFFTFME